MSSKHAAHANTLYTRLRNAPIAGKDNKFVITEEGVWFLPIGDDQAVPTLVQMLACVLQIDLDDDSTVEAVDAELESGRILLGYTSGESRRVEVHSLVDAPGEFARQRLAEVFANGLRITEADGVGHKPDAASSAPREGVKLGKQAEERR